MTTNYLDSFSRQFIGLDRLMKTLEQGQSSGFPPYDIVQEGEDRFRISVAVAGFKEQELTLELKDRVLTLTGKKELQDPTPITFLYRGIANRSFTRSWTLGEHVEVMGSSLDDGILTVDLERIVPEEKKPRLIAIGAGKKFLPEPADS